ncbi:MAG: hypothetical protein K5888_01690 [Lachnospiraceae bacterium]|nr:hypothetical protein [Lachnospiraceae bacterium]
MSTLLEIKQHVNNFFNKYEVYIRPVLKLILALTALLTINSKLGYMQKIDNISIVLVAALMCSFMPLNFIVFISALFIVLHMYALALEAAIVVLVLFIVLFLLYFRFSPKDTIVVVLTPIACMMGIPYVLPVVMGLVGGPYSAVSIGCGIVVTYALKSVNTAASSLGSMETEDMATRFRLVIDSVIDNKGMMAFIIAFAITVVIVYLIRRLPIDYSWPIAIAAGALADAIILLICSMSMDADISVAGIVLGTVLAVIAGFITQFLRFNVDYNRAEKLQFEDDEYYYYVKAVPKVTYPASRKRVKKINTATAHRPQRPRHIEYDEDDEE